MFSAPSTGSFNIIISVWWENWNNILKKIAKYLRAKILAIQSLPIFHTWHRITPVMTHAKFCSGHSIRILMTGKSTLLQRQMTIMASWITGSSSGCSRLCWDGQQRHSYVENVSIGWCHNDIRSNWKYNEKISSTQVSDSHLSPPGAL